MNFKRLIAQKVPPDHNSYLSAKNSFLVFKSATLQYSFYTKTFENVKIAIFFFKTYLLTAAIFGSRICSRHTKRGKNQVLFMVERRRGEYRAVINFP